MAEPLKYWYSPGFVARLGEALATMADFDRVRFEKSVLDNNWEKRELKDRMHHITHQVHQHLDGDFPQQLKALTTIAPQFTGFTAVIFPNFVEQYGQGHYEISLDALAFFTRFSTSEFAIRPFLKARPETIEVMYDWARDKNHHLRRLSSEGCRPLLPWAMKLEQYVTDPAPIIPILERLKNDKEDYVYRSVANNLNDISKHHPMLVLQLAQQWISTSETTDRVLKHALRTLLKNGNPEAMKLFGFGASPSIAVDRFAIDRSEIRIGESVALAIHLTNPGETAKFRLEFKISYRKKNGSYTHKVFRITEKIIETGQSVSLDKRIDFKDLSTRKHYPGEHRITLKINGVEKDELKAWLKQP